MKFYLKLAVLLSAFFFAMNSIAAIEETSQKAEDEYRITVALEDHSSGSVQYSALVAIANNSIAFDMRTRTRVVKGGINIAAGGDLTLSCLLGEPFSFPGKATEMRKNNHRYLEISLRTIFMGCKVYRVQSW